MDCAGTRPNRKVAPGRVLLKGSAGRAPGGLENKEPGAAARGAGNLSAASQGIPEGFAARQL